MSDSGRLKHLEHRTLIDLVIAFAPNIPNGGVCNGFTSMWLQAVATNDEQEAHFYRRLDGISNYFHHPNTSAQTLKNQLDAVLESQIPRPRNLLRTQDLDLIDIRAFAESVAIQQDAFKLNIFKTPIFPRDKAAIYPFTSSAILAQTGEEIRTDLAGTLAANKTAIELYFNRLKEALEQTYQAHTIPLNKKIGFLMISDDHAIGAYLHPQSKMWHFLDINQLSGKLTYYFSVDSAALAPLVFRSFGDENSAHTAFTVHCVSTCHDEKLARSLKAIADDLLAQSIRNVNSRGYNALLLGSLVGDETGAKILLKSGQNKRTSPLKSKKTPLMLAAQSNHVDTLKTIIDTSKIRPKGYVDALTFSANQAYEFCSRLLENDLNDVDKDGNTALMYAAIFGRTEAIQLLISRGASTHLQNKEGTTALMFAATHNCLDAVMALNQTTPSLFISHPIIAAQHTLETLNLFAPKEINLVDEQGDTALMLATLYGHLEIVQYLASQKADMEIKNKEGNTAVLLAIKHNQTHVFHWLLSQQVDLHVKNKQGYTILMYAIERGHIAIVKGLISNQAAHLHLKNKEGQTALMLAAKRGDTEMIELLIDQGASVNATDKQGRTPLGYAKHHNNNRGHKEAIEILTKHGAVENAGWHVWLKDNFKFNVNKKESLTTKEKNKKNRF